MNRTALALLMLRTLKNRDLIQKQELADILETNPRNIIELKKELETAGYLIETTSGPRGGYRLKEEGALVVPPLSNEETIALKEVLQYLRDSDTTLRKEAEEAMEKLLAAQHTGIPSESLTVSGTKLSMAQEQLQRYYESLRKAIHGCYRVHLAYRPRNQEVKEWMIHPYGLFLYRGLWYLVGWRESDHVITIKLNRIVSLLVTEIHFAKPDDFDIRQYVNSYGIAVGKKERLKLKITGRYYLSEYVYGEDQRITSLDDKTILLEVTMQGDIAIRQFVLDLGSDCEVLQPAWLRTYMKEEARKIEQVYCTKSEEKG